MSVISSRVAQRYITKIAFGAPAITSEDISKAIDTFKYNIGEIMIEHGSDPEGSWTEYGTNVSGSFIFRNIYIPISVDVDTEKFELTELAPDAYFEPYAEMNDEEYKNWTDTYKNFDFSPIFKAINEKYGSVIDGEIYDKIQTEREVKRDMEESERTERSYNYWREL